MRNIKLKVIMLVIILSLLAIVLYLNRPMTMNDLKGKPSIEATVMEVLNNQILVMTTSEKGDLIYVSLDTDLKDSMRNFEVNQQVKIYYDGTILETYPYQINNCYAILLLSEEVDLIPMVMINQKIYYDTNKESDIGLRCGVMDGVIKSMVKQSEIPTKNDQSNFGQGYEYQWVDENNVDLNIDGKFYRFTAR